MYLKNGLLINSIIVEGLIEINISTKANINIKDSTYKISVQK